MPRRRNHHRRVDAVVDNNELSHVETLSDQRVAYANGMCLWSGEEAMLTACGEGEWGEA